MCALCVYVLVPCNASEYTMHTISLHMNCNLSYWIDVICLVVVFYSSFAVSWNNQTLCLASIFKLNAIRCILLNWWLSKLARCLIWSASKTFILFCNIFFILIPILEEKKKSVDSYLFSCLQKVAVDKPQSYDIKLNVGRTASHTKMNYLLGFDGRLTSQLNSNIETPFEVVLVKCLSNDK